MNCFLPSPHAASFLSFKLLFVGHIKDIHGHGSFGTEISTEHPASLQCDDSRGLVVSTPASVHSVNTAPLSSRVAGSRAVLRVALSDDTMDCHSMHHVIHSRVQTV